MPPVSLHTMACQCTYWRQGSAYAGLVEGVEFFCTGDGLVHVGFHGGREGQWTALGMRWMTAYNGEYGGNRARPWLVDWLIVDCSRDIVDVLVCVRLLPTVALR